MPQHGQKRAKNIMIGISTETTNVIINVWFVKTLQKLPNWEL